MAVFRRRRKSLIHKTVRDVAKTDSLEATHRHRKSVEMAFARLERILHHALIALFTSYFDQADELTDIASQDRFCEALRMPASGGGWRAELARRRQGASEGTRGQCCT